MQHLSIDQIRREAPSVFAEAPAEHTSDKYKFVPTSEVLYKMMEQGFMPVYAKQKTARKSERLHSNLHVIRFRHEELSFKGVGDSIPEIVLMNSHNGSCCYNLMFGIFRMVCENGMIVKSASLDEVKVRHIGSVADNVIDASFELVNKAPEVADQVVSWQQIEIDRRQQKRLADLSKEARYGFIDFDVESLLQARRPVDDVSEGGNRSVWKTMNVIQENLVKGGFIYEDANGKTRTAREVKATHANALTNRKLWDITDQFVGRLKV